jgi:hypothetical protein
MIPVSPRVSALTIVRETEVRGRTKRCLYLLESCSVDDPYRL